MRSICCLNIAALYHLPAAAIYKCVDSGGKISLQDAPCKSTDAAVKIDVQTVLSPSTPGLKPYAADIARQAAEEKEQERQARAETARHHGTASVGMREDEVLRALGKPSTVNRSSSGPDQWVYYRGGPGRALYLYLENGAVRSWQETGLRK